MNTVLPATTPERQPEKPEFTHVSMDQVIVPGLIAGVGLVYAVLKNSSEQGPINDADEHIDSLQGDVGVLEQQQTAATNIKNEAKKITITGFLDNKIEAKQAEIATATEARPEDHSGKIFGEATLGAGLTAAVLFYAARAVSHRRKLRQYNKATSNTPAPKPLAAVEPQAVVPSFGPEHIEQGMRDMQEHLDNPDQ